jgi:hypothetical protein
MSSWSWEHVSKSILRQERKLRFDRQSLGGAQAQVRSPESWRSTSSSSIARVLEERKLRFDRQSLGGAQAQLQSLELDLQDKYDNPEDAARHDTDHADDTDDTDDTTDFKTRVLLTIPNTVDT